MRLFQIPQRYRFSSKSQQLAAVGELDQCCFRYHKGTDFQANHNKDTLWTIVMQVVLDTTKVQIFKQITTQYNVTYKVSTLFQIPQRYRFSSKSQLSGASSLLGGSCFRYHKGTDFQANHNSYHILYKPKLVVLDTTKVQIFKQITTLRSWYNPALLLFQIPQRYRFSSKSQLVYLVRLVLVVVLDTTKVQIFKQITTML